MGNCCTYEENPKNELTTNHKRYDSSTSKQTMDTYLSNTNPSFGGTNENAESVPCDEPIIGERKVELFENNDGFYEGEVIDSNKDGFGIYKFYDGNVYKGYFEFNCMNGLIRHLQPLGDTFLGTYKYDERCGLGNSVQDNGLKYKGEWEKNQKNGFGLEINKDGAIYTGEFKNDKRNGFGTLIKSDGSLYEGEFFEGEFEGVGKLTNPDGTFYKGEWKNSSPFGYGVYKYSENKVFEGTFKNEEKHGFGVYCNHDKIYVGIWTSNKLEGEAAVIVNGNTIKNSLWRDGKKVEYLDTETEYISICQKLIEHN